jgi:hypothetical protein
MTKVKNMIGYQSEFFEVLGQSDKTDKSYCTYWYCQCTCGRLFEARGHDIRRGRQKSCGCLSARKTRKHGALSKNARPEARKTYTSWSNMLARCYNPKSTSYRYYGAKGVSVCARWNPKAGGSFANFLADMGYRPKGTTIGRWFDTGNYEPGNCYWQTSEQQGLQRFCKRILREYPVPALYGLRTAGSPQPTI